MSRGALIAIAVILLIVYLAYYYLYAQEPTADAAVPDMTSGTVPVPAKKKKAAPKKTAPKKAATKKTATTTAAKPITVVTPATATSPATVTTAVPVTPVVTKTGTLVGFYADPQFKGKSVFLGAGKKSLKGTVVANSVSSIKVPAGMRVVAYDKKDCTGKSLTFTSDVSTLKGVGLNDDIACVDITAS